MGLRCLSSFRWLGLALFLSVSGIALPSSSAQAYASNTSRSPQTARTYPLSKMPLLRLVLRLLQRFYIDPTQFKAKNMHRSGLQALERKLAEVQVTWAPQEKAYTVRLGPHTQTWKTGRFIGLFDVWLRLRPVAEFIGKHYRGDVPISEIEYAMVLGVMSTLDKQTRVISREILMRRRALRPQRKKGKIGAVLSWDKKTKQILIRSVVQDGPADLAGLKPNDRILAVDGAKVQGGGLLEWIGKIIGLRGSRVALTIARKGWAKPKRVVLIRALMAPPLVVSHLLPGKIGYIRLRQFAQGASLLIREHLARLRQRAKGNLLGLALDLRDNPGGRITEAVEICSLFVERGEVVTYAGANTKRKTYHVTGRNVEAQYPLVVLINDFSASASELLSGALQGNNRALVIGQQSYGKGTVQSVSGMPRLGLLYRVTVAQYMVPPDRSIQMVGIAPDIALTPISVKSGNVSYFSKPLRDQEARKKRWPKFLQQYSDPDAHFLMNISYLTHHAPGDRFRRKKRPRSLRTWWIDATHPLADDFEVWVARYMLANAQSSNRDVFFKRVKRPLEQLKQLQQKRLVRALKKRKIDWQASSAFQDRPALLTAKVKLLNAKLPVPTGKTIKLQVTVRPAGKVGVYRLRAIVHTPLPMLRYKEMLFGTLRFGRSVTQTLEFKLPHSLREGVVPLTIRYKADKAFKIPSTQFLLSWRSPSRPTYRIQYQILDPAPDGNGDGQLQAGEKAYVRMTIKQQGGAQATRPLVRLFVERTRVSKARQRLKSLQPGKSQTVWFEMRVPDNAKAGRRYSTITLVDPTFGARIKHRLGFQVVGPLPPPSAPRWVMCAKPVLLYNRPSSEESPIATLGAGAMLQVKRTHLRMHQVQLPLPQTYKTRHGLELRTLSAWLPQAMCQTASKAPEKQPSLVWLDQFVPPKVTWGFKPTNVVQTSTPKLKLTVVSEYGIRDLFVMQKKNKPFYKVFQYKNPKGTTRTQLRLPLKLKPGWNRLRLVVRTLQGAFTYPFQLSYQPKGTASR